MSLPVADPPAPPAPSTQPAPVVRTGRPPRDRLRAWVGAHVVSVAVAALVVVAGLAWLVLRPSPGAGPPRVAYSELLTAMEAGRVESLVVRPGRDIRGTWAGAAGTEPGFVVGYPVASVDGLAARAEEAGVTLSMESAPDRRSPDEVATLLVQLLVVAGVGYLLFRHLRGGEAGGSVGGAVTSDTTFADVAGTQGAAEELVELVEFLRRPDRFRALGARTPKGALLVGPPGVGKTLLARAVAGEAGVPFFSLSGSEVTGFLVGMGAHRIKSLFRKARKKGGVIFIDEIDALGGKRGQNRGHNEDDRTLNQLLVEMDGFSPLDGVVVIAATNRPDDLDPALKRPGRFDRIVTVASPTAHGREAILRLHAGRRGIPLDGGVDLGRLARLTPGSSGAELANLLNEAAIAAAREGDAHVRWTHVEHARDRMLLGRERHGFRALDRERCTIAYHEAGHALAGVLCCPDDGLHKVTIQARGQALGVAFFSPDDDRQLWRRDYLEGLIVKGLGGRAAEEVVFGAQAVTSGAQSDLQQVNSIARKMVYHLGMGEDTGLLVHDPEAPLSAEAHAQMDREVRAILERLYVRTVEVMRANREPLAALAVALLEQETLDGADALAVLRDAGLTEPADLLPEAIAAD